MIKVIYAILIVLVTAITVQIPYMQSTPGCQPPSSSSSGGG